MKNSVFWKSNKLTKWRKVISYLKLKIVNQKRQCKIDNLIIIIDVMTIILIINPELICSNRIIKFITL
jgi:hypothetical protein